MPDIFGTGYPPAHDTWRFPPPEVSRRWKWAAIAASVAGLVLAVTATAVLVVLGSDDVDGLIEDEDLTGTIAAQCLLMTSTVEQMPLTGPTTLQAETIIDQNRAVELMVATIRRENAQQIRTDQPAEQWLRDWDRLVDARERYARRLLRDPGAALRIPRDGDGRHITDRMDDVWLGERVCEVPETLRSARTDAYAGA
jgi:hypothetical protein